MRRLYLQNSRNTSQPSLLELPAKGIMMVMVIVMVMVMVMVIVMAMVTAMVMVQEVVNVYDLTYHICGIQPNEHGNEATAVL